MLARKPSWEEIELIACADDFAYWARRYFYIFDTPSQDWILFDLWPAQVEVSIMIDGNQYTILLKPRQVGISRLVLAIILHGMLFRPVFQAGIFSKREDEAFYLLEQLVGAYKKLPKWMQARQTLVDNASQLQLSNGSGVRAFPWNAGDSYTLSFAFVDEADLVPNLNHVMLAVKPTIDAGGKLVMVSKINKAKPESLFKKIYKAAKKGENQWATMFLAWWVHPGRTQAWYDKEKADTLANTGALDALYESYPATDVEALMGKTLDKRIPGVWLMKCYQPMKPIPLDELPAGAPTIPALLVYALPESGVKYVIGGDPAEGNPNSDDSSFHVLRADTYEEVAMLAGKFEPDVFASQIDTVGQWFNRAAVMVERNNHGHAIISWLRGHSPLTLLRGLDKKTGWLSNGVGKARLYDNAAEFFKDGTTVIHTFKTYEQLEALEGATLRAPEQQMDDCADSYALTLASAIRGERDMEVIAG